MKYLLLILFILLVIFATKALRSKGDGQQGTPRKPAPPPAGGAEDGGRVMLACAQCGLHLPSNEALPGKGGVFCSQAHRAQFEAREDVSD
jgi:uncharacterized protein